jgi:gas vesicle protein
MRRFFGFTLGILTGAVIGSTIALLLAPESGEAFRRQLIERGEILRTEIREAAAARQIELRERLETLRTPPSV